MSRVTHPVCLLALAVFGLIAVSGCATPVSTAETKATSAMAEARKASAEASAALKAAKQAQKEAEENKARIDRMFKQTMKK